MDNIHYLDSSLEAILEVNNFSHSAFQASEYYHDYLSVKSFEKDYGHNHSTESENRIKSFLDDFRSFFGNQNVENEIYDQSIEDRLSHLESTFDKRVEEIVLKVIKKLSE